MDTRRSGGLTALVLAGVNPCRVPVHRVVHHHHLALVPGPLLSL